MKKSIKIKQRDITDCGAACLTSVAAHYDRQLPVARVRQLASTDTKGTNVLGMVEAATKLGFDAKGVKGTFDSLFKITKPAIAHVVISEVLHHFVVINNTTSKYIEVMDPARGELHRYNHEEFKKIWTGVLVLLIPGESFETGDEKISVTSRLLNLVNSHKSALGKALLGAIIYTIIGLSTSIFVQKVIDNVLVDGDYNFLNLMGVMMTALLIMSILIGYMKSLIILKTGQMIDTRLILGYYKHLLKLPLQFFDAMRVGEVLSRINDAVKIRTFINDVSINLVVNLLVILFSFMLMFTYYWRLAIIILLMIPLYGLVYFIANKLNKRVERQLMEHSAELESQFVESLNSVGTIKSFGLERHSNVKTESKFNSLLETIHKSGVNNLFSNFSTEFISRSFTIILLWVGSSFVIDSEITPGELLSFYALLAYFTGPASSLIGTNKVIQNAMIAADRLFEIMDLEREGEENGISLVAEMMGDIQFANVNFRYGTRVTVFQDFNLTIPKGNVVALVGESGSGKSTLISILQKLYPVLSGSVRFGEYDLKYLDNNSLRRLVAVVPQKIDLFAGNVIDNIAVGEEQPDLNKIISICTSLGILGFIEKLPAGFNTYLGENGATLSGGQKQRIAIARALYRGPEVLILDEATSSLDSAAEKYVQKMVEILREQNKTVIIIAHRLSTVSQADKIVVLENGKVAEEGTHEELFGNRKQYFQLWKNQFPVMEVVR